MNRDTLLIVCCCVVIAIRTSIFFKQNHEFTDKSQLFSCVENYIFCCCYPMKFLFSFSFWGVSLVSKTEFLSQKSIDLKSIESGVTRRETISFNLLLSKFFSLTTVIQKLSFICSVQKKNLPFGCQVSLASLTFL